MKRREAIAGAASLGVLGAGGALAVGGFPSFGSSSDGSNEHPQLDEPVTVPTVDLSWSDGEPITVPIEDTVTVLEFWATTCTVCPDAVPKVTAAADRTGEDVAFVAITAEDVGPDDFSPEYIEDTWRDFGGGEWPMGYGTFEVQVQLTSAATPATAIIDADGVTQWTHTGIVSSETILEEIEAAGGTVR